MVRYSEINKHQRNQRKEHNRHADAKRFGREAPVCYSLIRLIDRAFGRAGRDSSPPPERRNIAGSAPKLRRSGVGGHEIAETISDFIATTSPADTARAFHQDAGITTVSVGALQRNRQCTDAGHGSANARDPIPRPSSCRS
jgi:hypothetical protein